MGIFFRQYEITDEEGLQHIFKHYPNQGNKIIVDKDDIDASLHARRDLFKMLDAASSFMEDNTICKVEIEEGIEEGTED